MTLFKRELGLDAGLSAKDAVYEAAKMLGVPTEDLSLIALATRCWEMIGERVPRGAVAHV